MPLPHITINFVHEPNLKILVQKHQLLFLAVSKKPQTQEQALDTLLGNPIARARQQSKKFKAQQNQLLDVSGFPTQGKLGRIILLGTEKSPQENTQEDIQEDIQESTQETPDNTTNNKQNNEKYALLKQLFQQGATLLARTHAIGTDDALWIYDGNERSLFLRSPEAAAETALGATLASYHFHTYLSEDDKEEAENRKLALKQLTLSVAGAQFKQDELEHAWKQRRAEAEGICLARDLVNEPPNTLNPKTFAARLLTLPKTLDSNLSKTSSKNLSKNLGKRLQVEVLDEKRLEKIGFRALLAVARASEHAARVVVMRYTPPRKSSRAPLVLVGKGVTFDSGGLSLKPANSMEDMKMDMGGAAAVAGAMATIALQQPDCVCIGIVGLVENMPGGNAQRPGDIVRTLSGKTVEVLNTDAEGRLVLADLLWYAQQQWQPRAMVNLATLTGAMIVALGEEYAGFFANDDTLATELEGCSKATGEKIWRLPLDAAYDALLRSPVADMKNIGGGGAGAITAAQFLQRFVRGGKGGEGKTSWAHIDIAGVTWATKARLGRPRGASGFGVRLLSALATRLARDEDSEGDKERKGS